MFLPDGKHFLYVTLPAKQGKFDVFVGSIDSKERVSPRRRARRSMPSLIPHLPAGKHLVAQPFDAGRFDDDRRFVSPEKLPRRRATGGQVAPASSDGVMTRWALGLRTPRFAGTTVREKCWARFCARGPVREIRLSRWKALSPSSADQSVSSERRLADRPRSPRPFASYMPGPGSVDSMAWSPDDHRIAFSSDRNGPWDIYVKSTEGAAEDTAVLSGGAVSGQNPMTVGRRQVDRVRTG